MAKPSRWTEEKRYQIVKEALSQKEPVGQIARRPRLTRRATVVRILSGWILRGAAGRAARLKKTSGGDLLLIATATLERYFLSSSPGCFPGSKPPTSW